MTCVIRATPLTAAAGANLRELMTRTGHSSTRAALIYLHSTDERQQAIAGMTPDEGQRPGQRNRP
jgi:hypothetical protein